MSFLDNQLPLVSINCTTYNHGKYIRECLDGLLIQQTSFSFEILVHDDASTDNTPGIIREYQSRFPNIVKPIYQSENQYSKNVNIWSEYQLPRALGKYCAICEGDDYWNDPCKLQKQIDFLEGNPNYGMCFTKARIYHQENACFGDLLGGGKTSFADLLSLNNIPTLTTVFQTDLLRDYFCDIDPVSKNWLMGDYPMWLWFSVRSQIKFINEVTGVYRVLSESANHTTDFVKRENFIKSYYDIQSFFVNLQLDEFGQLGIADSLNRSLASNAIAYDNMGLAKQYLNQVRNPSIKDLSKKWFVIPLLAFRSCLRKRVNG